MYQILYNFREMDKVYPVVREEIDDMAGCTGEMARIRMIHKNFKDEATRIRVQHITNLIETDIYEEANNELKVMFCHLIISIFLYTHILASTRENLSLGVHKQQWRSAACASAQSDQRQCCSLIEKYNT